ncbi:MAG: hypothetical protein ACRYFK_15260 [Janthinobacterium lividum]
MAEPDKDLPLVVAEILIEMHGMNGRLTNVEKRLENVENILVQAVDNIQQLSKAVNRTAEVVLSQQQGFNRRFDEQQTKSDQQFKEQLAKSDQRFEQHQQQFDQQQRAFNQRFEQLQQADREHSQRLERTIASIDNRFERLENR